MELHHSNRLQIDLRDEEVETMREIVRLAYTHLRNAPCVQMHGNPCKKQAGLMGPQLVSVKTMLENFGRAVGVDCPYDAPPDDPSNQGNGFSLSVITHG